jgi:hypothetical protein
MSDCTSTTTGSTDEVLVAIWRGDTLRLTVTLADEDKQPVNVTGWGWLCQLRTADDVVAGELDVLPLNLPGGRLELFMDQLDTAQLAVADYRFDLQATDAASDVRTILHGQLRVRADVSRSAG